MVKVTLSNIIPAGAPSEGWIVNYRKKGTNDPYTALGPFTAQPIEFTTVDPGGTLYEGNIITDCGALNGEPYNWTTVCTCPGGYQVMPGETGCQKLESVPPTITNPGYCLAPSTNNVYTQYEARVYNAGLSQATLNLPTGSSGGFIFGRSNTPGQWANPTLNASIGPMNRSGVWIDSDCDGTRNPLESGEQTTIAFTYNNTGAQRTVYVGCGADNAFTLIANGTEIVSTVNDGTDLQFKIWHIIPVTLKIGLNYFNLVGIGDGSFNDALAMVVYDNTPNTILGATADGQLNILFNSASLRGTTYDVATCADGYSLDTSGGQGAYVCTRILNTICNGA